jgi:hypothetical protein
MGQGGKGEWSWAVQRSCWFAQYLRVLRFMHAELSGGLGVLRATVCLQSIYDPQTTEH